MNKILIPSVVKIDLPDPEPKSQSTKFHDEWQKDWLDVNFETIISRWKKEEK